MKFTRNSSSITLSILSIICFCFTISLSSCGDDDEKEQTEIQSDSFERTILGKWFYKDSPSNFIEFKSNGSGIFQEGGYNYSINWYIENKKLTLIWIDESEDDVDVYPIIQLDKHNLVFELSDGSLEHYIR